MRKVTKSSLQKIATLILLFSSSEGIASTHVVKEGESLSSIVQKRLVGNIWGRKGNLKKVLEMNRWIRNPNKIQVGKIVQLGNLPLLENQVEANIDELKPEHSLCQDLTPRTGKKKVKHRKLNAALDMNRSLQVSLGSEMSSSFGKNVSLPFRHHLVPELDYRFTTLEALNHTSGESIVLQSQYSVHLTVAWSMDWSERFSSFIKFGFTQLNFSTSTADVSSISQTSHTQYHFSLGAKIHVLPRTLALKYSLFYGEKIFLHMESPTVVALDSLKVPWMTGQAEWTIYSSDSFGLGTTVFGSFVGPADGNYFVYLGTILSANVYTDFKFGYDFKNSLRFFGAYSNRKQDTSLFSLNQKDTIFGVIYSLLI